MVVDQTCRVRSHQESAFESTTVQVLQKALPASLRIRLRLKFGRLALLMISHTTSVCLSVSQQGVLALPFW